MLLINPEVIARFVAHGLPANADPPTSQLMRGDIGGVPYTCSPEVPKHPKKWVFPKERFWIYEDSDEDWCRAIGLGHEEDDTTKLVAWKLNPPDFRMPCTPQPVTFDDELFTQARRLHEELMHHRLRMAAYSRPPIYLSNVTT